MDREVHGAADLDMVDGAGVPLRADLLIDQVVKDPHIAGDRRCMSRPNNPVAGKIHSRGRT
jgi:hypothetical protein